MIIARAPLRINFAGGGTDVEPYISDYGSYILSAAIKFYSTITFGDDYIPSLIIEVILSELGNKPIRILSDVPSTSGLGGSGCCFVAGLKAIYPQLDKEQIAQLALYLEQKVLKNTTGNQDQYCAAFGGLLFLTTENNETEVEQLPIPETLARRLILVYTHQRNIDGKAIIDSQNTITNTKLLHHQKQLAKSMKAALTSPNYREFAKLLNEAWENKKSLSPLISDSEIDELSQRCQTMGAAGSCLMGAGGGGYLLLMEDSEHTEGLRQNLINANISYSNIEFDTEGVKLLKGENK